MVNQWNAASRRNHSVERAQLVEMHKVDTVLEDLGRAPEGRSCSSLVFRYLNGGQHRTVHSVKDDKVPAGIDHRYIHLPIPLLRLSHSGVNNGLGGVNCYRCAIRGVERNCVRHKVESIRFRL
jgi:hypothetical protein